MQDTWSVEQSQLVTIIVKGEIMPVENRLPVGAILAQPPSFTGKFVPGNLVKIAGSTLEVYQGLVLPMIEQSASLVYRQHQVRVALNTDRIAYLDEKELELIY